MPEQFAITEEMKHAECLAWKERLANRSFGIGHEIRPGMTPKFVNADVAAPLAAFAGSDAADDALDAAIEAFGASEE